jgi:hypothetical protein
MADLKNKITNICGVVFAVCSAILTATTSGMLVLPEPVNLAAGLLIAISGGVIGYLTGKKPDGGVKSDKAVNEINSK